MCAVLNDLRSGQLGGGILRSNIIESLPEGAWSLLVRLDNSHKTPRKWPGTGQALRAREGCRLERTHRDLWVSVMLRRVTRLSSTHCKYPPEACGQAQGQVGPQTGVYPKSRFSLMMTSGAESPICGQPGLEKSSISFSFNPVLSGSKITCEQSLWTP